MRTDAKQAASSGANAEDVEGLGITPGSEKAWFWCVAPRTTSGTEDVLSFRPRKLPIWLTFLTPPGST